MTDVDYSPTADLRQVWICMNQPGPRSGQIDTREFAAMSIDQAEKLAIRELPWCFAVKNRCGLVHYSTSPSQRSVAKIKAAFAEMWRFIESYSRGQVCRTT